MDALVLARLSLEEFALNSNKLLDDSANRRSRTDLVDALRTVFWYHGAVLRSKITSARGLEKKFEPESFWKAASQEVLRRNKWRRYRVGENVPKKSVVDRVEAELPGLQSELNHPLWGILSPKGKEISFGDWARQLAPKIRNALALHPIGNVYRSREALQLNKHLVNVLRKNASLDSLAAIILLTREAIAERRIVLARQWSRQIYDMLVILGHGLLTRGIARPLFDLIEKRVMSVLNFGEYRYFMRADHYLSGIDQIFDALWHLKERCYSKMTEDQKISYMVRIMDGDFGCDLKLALNPVRITKSHPDADDGRQWSFIENDGNLFQWAWNMLQIGGHRSFPPAEAANGSDLWARNAYTI